MRMLVVNCSVVYEGRLRALLPEAKRLILVKDDGSVSIHSETSGYKPLNWMVSPTSVRMSETQWVVEKKDERLTIDLGEVYSDVTVPLGMEPGLQKEGSEEEIQRLLFENPGMIEDGLVSIQREHPTPIGPIDILCRDKDGGLVVVEVKRVAGIDAIEQVMRYQSYLTTPEGKPVRMVVAAQVVKPQAHTFARDRGVECAVLDYEVLKGLESEKPPTLF